MAGVGILEGVFVGTESLRPRRYQADSGRRRTDLSYSASGDVVANTLPSVEKDLRLATEEERRNTVDEISENASFGRARSTSLYKAREQQVGAVGSITVASNPPFVVKFVNVKTVAFLVAVAAAVNHSFDPLGTRGGLWARPSRQRM
jgi:hypothetical protein